MNKNGKFRGVGRSYDKLVAEDFDFDGVLGIQLAKERKKEKT